MQPAAMADSVARQVSVWWRNSLEKARRHCAVANLMAVRLTPFMNETNAPILCDSSKSESAAAEPSGHDTVTFLQQPQAWTTVV